MINRRALRIALASRTNLDLLRVYRITARAAQPRREELQILGNALGVSPSELEDGEDPGS